MNYSKLSRKTFVASSPLASSSTFGSRLDLDASRISESVTRRETNKNEKLDLAYFEYLQNKMKKRIITTTIRNYEDLLQKQINYRQSQLFKIKRNLKKRKRILDNLTERNKLVGVLQSVEESFKQFENCCESDVAIENVITFSNMISEAGRNLQCVGVNKILNREEWLLLLKLMDDCCNFLSKFFKTNRDIKEFELIDQVSDGMRKVLELQIIIQESCLKSACLKKEICVHYLQEMADFFKLLGRSSCSG